MNKWRGSMVALASPFRDGSVDFESIEALVEWHIAEGTHVLCPAGCTGEAATFSEDEQVAVIRHVVETAAGRVPVMGGSGSNNTRTAIEMTKRVRDVGADAALIISPYYNKPAQDGIRKHYEAIAEAADFPICVYNVPGRTGSNILPETTVAMSKDPRIVMIKEASGNVDQVSAILDECDITVLSGDDSLTLPMMSVGAQGVISVVANVAPRLVSQMVESFLDGAVDRARELHRKVFRLHKALFCESNPIPVKGALAMMGKMGPEVRMPLTELTDAGKTRVRATLEELEIL